MLRAAVASRYRHVDIGICAQHGPAHLDIAGTCDHLVTRVLLLHQASDFANLLWALAASNQLQSESVAPLLASMGELPVDSFNAAALKQLAMVRAALPDPGTFAQHVPHALQQAVDQASQPLRGTDLFKVRDLAQCVVLCVTHMCVVLHLFCVSP